MAKITNDLLKEAIADAERVRETAIANAKLQLEESITPAIKRELTKALMETDEIGEAANPHRGAQANGFAEVGESVEADGTSVDEIANDSTSGIGGSDNKQPSPAASKSSGVGKSGESGNGEGETAQLMPEVKDDEDEDKEDLDEGILDLEAIIRELQAEVEALAGGDDALGGDDEEDALDLDGDADADAMDAPADDAAPADAAAEEPAGEAGDEEEDDLDIEEILREIEAELSEEDNNTVAEENARLKNELAEYRKAVQILRGKLNEVNLLNAKLLFTNKLFKNRELTKEQKVHVVETFDLATTLREVKLLYATLSEATIPVKTTKKQVASTQVVTESIASGVVGSTAPKKEVIAEDTYAGFRKRMQELAGVKVL